MPRTKSLSAIQAQIRALQKRARIIEAKADKKVTELVALIKRHSLSLGDWRRAVSLTKGRRKSGPRKGRRVPVKYADDKGNKWTGRGGKVGQEARLFPGEERQALDCKPVDRPKLSRLC